MALHISSITWSRPREICAPTVSFWKRFPSESTAAIRKLVPPRSTPIENEGMNSLFSHRWPGLLGSGTQFLNFLWSQPAEFAGRNIKLQRSVANTFYFFYVMTNLFEHAPDLPVLPLN